MASYHDDRIKYILNTGSKGPGGARNTGMRNSKGKWIGGAKKAIAEAEAKLAKATTDKERATLKEQLAKCKEGLAAGEAALKERQAFLDKALAKEPQLRRAAAIALVSLKK